MKYAHLSAGFMLTSIIGFLISVFLIAKIDMTWGFTFSLFFGIMFIASVVSATKADFTDKELQQELAIHEVKKRAKLKPRVTNSILPRKFTIPDALILLYAVLYLFFIVAILFVPENVDVVVTFFMVLILILLEVWTISEIFSTEKLTTERQIGYTIMVLLLGGIGIAIYYMFGKEHKK